MNIILEKTEDIPILKIARPEALNALNKAILVELKEKVLAMDSTAEKCFILTGEGKAFVAGADISEMAKLDDKEALEFARLGQEVFSLIEDSDLISIACINGYALGGGLELALSCDIRYSSDKARLGLPEVGLGLIPGFGGTQRLARLCGTGVAAEYIYSGEMFSSEEAFRQGVVNRVIPHEHLLEEGLKLAQTIRSRGRNALRNAKKSIRQGIEKSFAEGLKLEREYFSSLFGKDESKEGMNAFLEKRKPSF